MTGTINWRCSPNSRNWCTWYSNPGSSRWKI